MNTKSVFLTMNLLMMVLSAGALHAAEATQAEAAKPYACPAPILPFAVVRENQSGEVTLQYQATADGRFASIRILKSSGFKALDQTAIKTLSRCKLPIAADGETPPPGTMDFKFGPSVRVEAALPPQ
ncbi:MAG: TonB family protein [Pseudomonadota bacterium]